MPQITESIEIDSTVEAIYRVAKEEQSSFPDFMEDVSEVIVKEKDDNHSITEWTAEVEGIPIYWSEKDQFDNQNNIIRWQMLEGDFDKYDGTWEFIRFNGKTKSTLTIDYDFGMPSLTDLIGPTLETKVRENAQMMLKGLKSYCEKLI